MPPSGPSRVKEGAAFHWKISSPTDMCILKLDLKMEVRLAKISSLLDFQKLQTCCLVTSYCPFLHCCWPANLVKSESVYNEMLHLWINCFNCYVCFYRTRLFHLFSAKVMVFSELWTSWHIPHLEKGKVNFSGNAQKVIKNISLIVLMVAKWEWECKMRGCR